MNFKLPKKLTFTGAAVAVFVSAVAISKAPDDDSLIRYYSDSTYTELVGTRTTTCNGGEVIVGQLTMYSRLVYSEPCF